MVWIYGWQPLIFSLLAANFGPCWPNGRMQAFDTCALASSLKLETPSLFLYSQTFWHIWKRQWHTNGAVWPKSSDVLGLIPLVTRWIFIFFAAFDTVCSDNRYQKIEENCFYFSVWCWSLSNWQFQCCVLVASKMWDDSLSVVLIFTVMARACQCRVRPARRRWQGNCCKGECTMPALNHTLQTQHNPR